MSHEFSLVLGCGGYRYKDIVLCSGTMNVIINFSRHFDANELSQIMDFLDHGCGLFDNVVGDWNKVVNTLQLLFNKYKLISDDLWLGLHVWLPQHKKCGGYIKLVMNDELNKILIQNNDELVVPMIVNG